MRVIECDTGLPPGQTDLSVTLRPFGSLLLCLLVFLHRFLLFLGCLGLRFLLLLSRLLSLARTVWAAEDLSFSRDRPRTAQHDQQYEGRNSFHHPPGTEDPNSDLTPKLRPGLATNRLRNITSVTLKNWLIYEMSSSHRHQRHPTAQQ